MIRGCSLERHLQGMTQQLFARSVMINIMPLCLARIGWRNASETNKQHDHLGKQRGHRWKPPHQHQ